MIWDYRVVPSSFFELSEKLKESGNEGWELVQVDKNDDIYSKYMYQLFFKKLKK